MTDITDEYTKLTDKITTYFILRDLQREKKNEEREEKVLKGIGRIVESVISNTIPLVAQKLFDLGAPKENLQLPSQDDLEKAKDIIKESMSKQPTPSVNAEIRELEKGVATGTVQDMMKRMVERSNNPIEYPNFKQ